MEIESENVKRLEWILMHLVLTWAGIRPTTPDCSRLYPSCPQTLPGLGCPQSPWPPVSGSNHSHSTKIHPAIWPKFPHLSVCSHYSLSHHCSSWQRALFWHLCSPFRYRKVAMRPPNLLFSSLNTPTFLACLCMGGAPVLLSISWSPLALLQHFQILLILGGHQNCAQYSRWGLKLAALLVPKDKYLIYKLWSLGVIFRLLPSLYFFFPMLFLFLFLYFSVN